MKTSGKEILDYLGKQILKNWKKWNSVPDWTEGIKESLKTLGHQRKYKVCASLTKGSDYPEWLYDLCWSKSPIGGLAKFKGLSLIAEIEWKNENAILYDFQKLTIGVADFRLMIVCYGSGNRDENWAKNVISRCKKCCPKGKKHKYLFIAIPEEEDINKIIKEEWRI